MGAGRYRHRVMVQTVTETQTGSGTVVKAWTDWRRVWASISPSRGTNYFAAQQVQNSQSVTIRTRYHPGYRAGHRIIAMVDGTPQYYEVIDVIDPEMRHKEIEMMCLLRSADGFRSPK